MRRKRHTSEQIIRKLREAEAMEASGQTIGQACLRWPPSTMSTTRGTGSCRW